MSKFRTLTKALAISIKIKGPFSLAVSLLGFVTAFLPVLLAEGLRSLTDALQSLAGVGGSPKNALLIFAGIVGLFIAQLILTNLQQYVNYLDEIKIERYIRESVLRHKCEVRYKFIENDDHFQKRIAFIQEYSWYPMAKCINNLIMIIQLIIAFCGAAFALWAVNPWIVFILFCTSIPAALLSYFQQDETFRYRTKWIEEGAMAIHYFHMIGGGGYSYDGLQEIRHFALFDYLKACWRAIADT